MLRYSDVLYKLAKAKVVACNGRILLLVTQSATLPFIAAPWHSIGDDGGVRETHNIRQPSERVVAAVTVLVVTVNQKQARQDLLTAFAVGGPGCLLEAQIG